ncbi:MAG: hypothetical protein QXI22_00425 [Sulfolobales archaeon]
MSDSYEKRVEELKKHLMNEYSLLPEFIDGLTSIHEETEDYTCLTLKKLMGKREKGKPAAIILSQDDKAKEDCSSCPPG